MAIIDETRIKILVETQIATVSASVIPVVLYPGDTVPNNVDRWIKVLSIDFASLPNDREDSTEATGLDTAAVVVTVNCFASHTTMLNTSAALANVMAEVRKVLHRKTLRHDATTHQVDFMECRSTPDSEPDEQRRTATGVVIFTGIAFRTAGTSLVTHI